MTKPESVDITRDTKTKKKMVAVFYDSSGKKLKTVRFGQKGYTDYLQSKSDDKKRLYHLRHGKEKGGVMTASTLAKAILWNKKTLAASIKDYKKRYKLK